MHPPEILPTMCILSPSKDARDADSVFSEAIWWELQIIPPRVESHDFLG